MKCLEKALQSDGPVIVYLMLMESKVDALRKLNRSSGVQGKREQTPQVSSAYYN